MNERIKELAHQADFINKRHNGAEWRWGHIDPELNQKIEKFAELIVRECIGCLKPLSRNHSMVGAAQDTIREHFDF